MVNPGRIRTDVVGGLLRPDYLKDAYRQRDRGELDEEGLGAVQDRAVREAVALQEAVGLDVLTDGEYRRVMFEQSLTRSVQGLSGRRQGIESREQSVQGARPLTRYEAPPDLQVSVERLRLVRNQPLEEYRFTHRITRT